MERDDPGMLRLMRESIRCETELAVHAVQRAAQTPVPDGTRPRDALALHAPTATLPGEQQEAVWNDEQMRLCGGLRGRFQRSLNTVENNIEAVQQYLKALLTEEQRAAMVPVVQELHVELKKLRRLGDYAADAAMGPVLHCVWECYPMELSHALRSECRIFEEELAQTGTHIAVRCIGKEDLALPNVANERMLTSLMCNLFSNSVQALRGTENPQITVELYEDGFVYRDNGPGLPPGADALLFGGVWNQQLLESGALGLWVVRQYAASMDWKITEEPGPGMALRFTVQRCTLNPDAMWLESGHGFEKQDDAQLRQTLRQGLGTV